ncbi:hypothetical protein ACHAQA_008395 [Verticillium albo-atrum]
MPHKHTRRDHDPSSFDLPPSQIAKPLPVTRGGKHDDKAKPNTTGEGRKRKSRSNPDDGPRAFKRLMAFAQGKKTRSGLDNGDGGKKRRSASAATAPVAPVAPEAPEMPTIRPGEKMAEFSARVDAALPLSGLVTKTPRDGKDPGGIKVRRTKKERKMHKLYDQWRDEDKKIKEKRLDELEEAAERQMDEDLENGNHAHWPMNMGEASTTTSKKGKKKKKGRKAKAAEDEDPWEAFQKAHKQTKIGLHDVVQAPPVLNKSTQKMLTPRADSSK